jgi:hypothetical protein
MYVTEVIWWLYFLLVLALAGFMLYFGRAVQKKEE